MHPHSIFFLKVSLLVGFAFSNSSYSDLVVRDVHSTGRIDSLADADALLAGFGIESESTLKMSVINFRDVDRGSTVGHFTSDNPFPNNFIGVDDDDFAIQAIGQVYIPASGVWTFGVNSDDGSRLRIGGSDIIVDDSLHAAQDRFATVNLGEGLYDLDFVFFERGGTAAVELFAAQGSFNSFNSNFRLVGDTVSGGLGTSAVPEPNSLVVTSLLALIFGMRRRRSHR
ncbi:MAG: PA14 domain-containing protein [Planctomycetota bacterium]